MHAQHAGKFNIVVDDQDANRAPLGHRFAAFLWDRRHTPKM
jgi:hypothetical protein